MGYSIVFDFDTEQEMIDWVNTRQNEINALERLTNKDAENPVSEEKGDTVRAWIKTGKISGRLGLLFLRQRWALQFPWYTIWEFCLDGTMSEKGYGFGPTSCIQLAEFLHNEFGFYPISSK